jgi:hypothetical protein
LVVWDKDSYTERYLVLLLFICVLHCLDNDRLRPGHGSSDRRPV